MQSTTVIYNLIPLNGCSGTGQSPCSLNEIFYYNLARNVPKSLLRWFFISGFRFIIVWKRLLKWSGKLGGISFCQICKHPAVWLFLPVSYHVSAGFVALIDQPDPNAILTQFLHDLYLTHSENSTSSWPLLDLYSTSTWSWYRGHVWTIVI